jgi:AbrB family looped-hinge helix DNA binding protein
MTIATVSSKGQITLPIAARREAGIQLHDRVLIEFRKGEIVVRPAPGFLKFKGFAGKALTRDLEREAMGSAIAKHVAKRS